MSLPEPHELDVATLGTPTVPSPLAERRRRFVDEGRRILACSTTDELAPFLAAGSPPPSFEAAGPRERLFFDPRELTCGIVTCGGLCPGINNVIRSLVLTLTHAYGVPRIWGFRYGFSGLAARPLAEPVLLTPERVESIHEEGGTVLGSSRGPQDLGEMAASLHRLGCGVLFAVGGDGTLRGASALTAELRRRGQAVSVVGVPKTIDNDLAWIETSFGFDTAVSAASRALLAAHAEARGAWNGIGLVKLMGRHAGFITAHASLSSADVNFCLVPEVPFALEGAGGFLALLEERLASRHHALIALAEGAAQDLLQDSARAERDPSGNVKPADVGVFLKAEILRCFEARQVPVTLKYIDPSYTIRSLPANSTDSELCLLLGQHAAHAGLAGKTDVMIGYWNRHFTHVPIALAAGRGKRIDPQGDLWSRVLGATGQPRRIG